MSVPTSAETAGRRAGAGEPRGWRIANGVMLLTFAVGVVVQFNDPDPSAWVAMYALAAAACLFALLGRSTWTFPTAVAVVAVLWAVTLAPAVLGRVPFLDMFGAWEMEDLGIEESREMYGLLIIAAWMVVLAVRARRASQRGRPTSA